MKKPVINIYRIALLASFVLLNSLLLLGIGEVYSYLNSGTNPSDIFNGDLKTDINYHPEITWDTTHVQGRKPSKKIIEDIIKDYATARFILNNALQTGDKTGTDDLYTSNARRKISDILSRNQAEGITVETTHYSHHIDFELLSADGKLVAFSDTGVSTYYRIRKVSEIISEVEETADYKIVMLLEDGFWRIRHMERKQKQSQVEAPARNIPPPKSIKGVNYYPQASAWDTFGEQFDTNTINNDFVLIRDLGLTTIRIFINYEDFGKQDIIPEKMEKLAKLLDLASENNLNVIITLFDFYGDYTVVDWSATRKHAKEIVAQFKDHPAVVSWDIKNEPDLDFKSRGKSEVSSWLKNMVTLVKSLDSSNAVTIGWSSPESCLILSEEVDYVSFHYYKDLKEFTNTIKSLRSQTDKPIVLQEFGLSTNSGFWNPFASNEADQLEYYQTFIELNQEADVPFLFWTLYDFETVPDAITGWAPWRKNKQANFGIIRKDSSRKEAFRIIQELD